MSIELLKITNLKTYFFTREGVTKAVNDVSFKIGRNETFGLVGESGCGKTVTALSIMRLVPYLGKTVSGQIFFEGEDLLKKSETDIRRIRGSRISMIFQDPLTSLNPTMKIGNQIAEKIEQHMHLSREEAWEESINLINLVGIPDPLEKALQYPFQLSGGMRQRIMIAIALSCSPHLIIADEPTTNLDVTIQAQIIRLIREKREESKSSLLLITHNLALVAWLCDRLAVMYAGKIMEIGNSEQIFDKPDETKHPYTSGLLASIPGVHHGKKKLKMIKGSIPNLLEVPPGCPFHPRCEIAEEICSRKVPEPIEVEPAHMIRCHFVR